MQLLHHNFCTKSLYTLDFVNAQGIQIELIDYIKNPLTKEDLSELVKKLGIKASDLIRKSETLFQKKYATQQLTESECIEAMATHPILIERPIFINGEKAVIARPAERIFEIL